MRPRVQRRLLKRAATRLEPGEQGMIAFTAYSGSAAPLYTMIGMAIVWLVIFVLFQVIFGFLAGFLVFRALHKRYLVVRTNLGLVVMKTSVWTDRPTAVVARDGSPGLLAEPIGGWFRLDVIGVQLWVAKANHDAVRAINRSATAVIHPAWSDQPLSDGSSPEQVAPPSAGLPDASSSAALFPAAPPPIASGYNIQPTSQGPSAAPAPGPGPVAGICRFCGAAVGEAPRCQGCGRRNEALRI